jgi:hypothetical protein
MRGCLFVGCFSGKDGGGVDVRQSQITAKDCIFYFCYAKEYGGAISFEFNGSFVCFFFFFKRIIINIGV